MKVLLIGLFTLGCLSSFANESCNIYFKPGSKKVKKTSAVLEELGYRVVKNRSNAKYAIYSTKYREIGNGGGTTYIAIWDIDEETKIFEQENRKYNVSHTPLFYSMNNVLEALAAELPVCEESEYTN